MPKDKNYIHAKHRQRMRNRAEEAGISSFAAHEVLEMLLYTAIPRKNTNDISHKLLKAYGTIQSVTLAPQCELLRFTNMTQRAARLLTNMPYYLQEFSACNRYKGKYFGNKNDFLILASENLSCGKNEYILLCLTNLMITLYSEAVTITGTRPDPKEIIDTAIKHKADLIAVILTSPSCFPDDGDICFAAELEYFSTDTGVTVHEIAKFCGNGMYFMYSDIFLPKEKTDEK